MDNNLRKRFTIIFLINKMKEGEIFDPKYYPLHITIVPSFQISISTTAIKKELASISKKISRFNVTVSERELFGPNYDIEVNPIKINDNITNLHNILVTRLGTIGAVFEELWYIQSGYRPHCTIQDEVGLMPGDFINIDSFTIIDKMPSGNHNKRKILHNIKLKDI